VNVEIPADCAANSEHHAHVTPEFCESGGFPCRLTDEECSREHAGNERPAI
jgi:hypothetical protein